MNLDKFNLSIGQRRKVEKVLNFGIDEIVSIKTKCSDNYLYGVGQNYKRLVVVYMYKGEKRRSEFAGQDNGKPYKD